MVETARRWLRPFVVAGAVTALVLTGPASLAAADPGDPLWVATEGDETFGANVYRSAVAPDGTVVVAGSAATPNAEFGLDWFAAAYAPDGTRLWRVRLTLPGLTGGTGAATAVGIDAAGGQVVVAGGLSAGIAGRDMTAVAFDLATGQRRWLTRYDGPGGYDDVLDLTLDPASGRTFLTGASSNAAGDYDYLTMAVDRDGTRAWQRRDASLEGYDDRATAIARGADGDVYVTGYTEGASGRVFSRTVSYTSEGALRWRNRTSVENGVQTRMFDIAVDDARGRVYLAGWRQPGFDRRPTTVTTALGLDGVEAWTVEADNGNDRWNTYLAVDPTSGQIYVASSRGPTANDTNALLTAYAPDSSLLWARTFGAAGRSEFAEAVAVDPTTGQVFVGVTPLNDDRSILLAYAANGQRQWVRYQSTPQASRVSAYTVVVDPSRDRVYIGGGLIQTDLSGRAYLAAYATA